MTASTSASGQEHAGSAAAPDRRPGIDAARGLGIVSLLLGAGLVAIAGHALFQYWTEPAALPYQRVLIEEGSAADFPDLGLKDDTAGTIRRYELRTDGIDRPLVDFVVVEQQSGPPVPLSWDSKLTEPVLIADAHVDDAKNVAETLTRHLPDHAVVFSWWDTSRRLAFVGDIPVAFAKAGPDPLLVPTVWADHGPLIRDAEHVYWAGQTGSLPDQGRFDKFQEVLLMDAGEGIGALSDMADSKRAYIVLNVFDAYKLGTSAPNALGIGFKDFGKSAETHGMIKGVKAWIEENGYTSYMVYPMSDSVVRVFYLTDGPSEQTLLAALLPFSNSSPDKVPGTKLVHQYRGYWIYEITP